MSKQVSAGSGLSADVARDPASLKAEPLSPVGLDAGFGAQHLTAIAEPSCGFHEQPAAFNAMPEAMPPPPSRPELPPDLQSEPQRPGLLARLMGAKGR